MFRHCDWAARFPGEEVDEPGVILDNCVLGKAKEGGTEVHAHGGVPAITVIPDVFKHLHGRKGLEGADETLWGTEASNDIWDPQEERLSPPFQELVSVEALPLARAVHLLGGLELHIAGWGLCGWSLGVCAIYLSGEEQRVVSQAAA